MPTLRGALRQGRPPGRMCRRGLSVPLRVRGGRPHVRRAACRRSTTSRSTSSCSKRRGPADRIRRGEGAPPAAPDVQRRGLELLREPQRRPRVREPRVLRASAGQAVVPRHRADRSRLGAPCARSRRPRSPRSSRGRARRSGTRRWRRPRPSKDLPVGTPPRRRLPGDGHERRGRRRRARAGPLPDRRSLAHRLPARERRSGAGEEAPVAAAAQYAAGILRGTSTSARERRRKAADRTKFMLSAYNAGAGGAIWPGTARATRTSGRPAATTAESVLARYARVPGAPRDRAEAGAEARLARPARDRAEGRPRGLVRPACCPASGRSFKIKSGPYYGEKLVVAVRDFQTRVGLGSTASPARTPAGALERDTKPKRR